MHIFFQGADAADHRKRLAKAGVKHVSLSYLQLEKRIKKPLNWSLEDHFDDDVEILLDSGAFSASKKDDWTEEDWMAYVDRYCEFAEANIDRVSIVTEFDGVSLGREYVEDMREAYWDGLGLGERFMPVWHEEHGGLQELEKLAQEHERIAITASALDSKRVMANRLNRLVQRFGLKLHGLAITKPDDILAVKFDSVSSTSWVSPMRYGDTIIWDGHRLRRYPMKYKENARKRNARLIEKSGFDAAKIQADDPSEVVALSIWSWLQFEEAMNRRKGRQEPQEGPHDDEDGWLDPDEAPVAATPDVEDDSDLEEEVTPTPVTAPSEERKFLPVKEEDLVPLPVMAFDRVMKTDEQGVPEGSTHIMRSVKQSIRQCDTCYVAATCPVMEPGSACKFSLPVEIRTKEQLQGAMQAVVEMQAQRIMFARYTEELEGGYIDPNVSNEVDRFFGALAKMQEIMDNRDMLKIQVEARGQAGVLSRIFGSDAAAVSQDAIDPAKADEALNEIIDVAEVVE